MTSTKKEDINYVPLLVQYNSKRNDIKRKEVKVGRFAPSSETLAS